MIITYPPELLPRADDDGADVFVYGDSGDCELVASFPPPPNKEPLGGVAEKTRVLSS